MEQKIRKGIQLNQAVMAIVTLVLIAVLVIVSIYMFSGLGTTMLVPNTAGISYNETVTNPMGGSSHVQSVNLRDGSCGTFTQIWNGTTGSVAIGLGNFTQTGCSFNNVTSMAAYSSSLRVTYPYTYTADSSGSNASDSMVTQFAAYPALIGLVGTIIFLGIVIGVLVASFVFGGKKGA